MQTSSKGRQFIMLHEGNPLAAYWDPATPPVATVGPGLTNLSPVVTRMIGKIVPGKTKITAQMADRVFATVLAEEVEPAVTRGMVGAKQHEFDAAASGGYNLGAVRFMGWEWANLWRKGQKVAAWDYLASHYNTAGGKILPGLKRRRQEEALLGKMAFYTGVDGGPLPENAARPAGPESQADPTVKEAQEILVAQGFNPGKVDGWMGEKTAAAIRAYQSQHPHLTVDGVLGAATLAQLRRDAQALGQLAKDSAIKVAPAAAGAGWLSSLAHLPWGWIIAGVVVVGVAFFAWRYRDIWLRKMRGAK